MTLSDIQTKIYALTGLTDNPSAYPSANMLIDINIWLQKIAGMIFDAQDETEWDDANRTDYPIITTPLTTNRDYEIPVNLAMLKIKDVSVSYDGVDYYQAAPLDITETVLPVAPGASTTEQADIDNFFQRTSPRYSIKYGSLWLYPMGASSDVAEGGEIIMEFQRSPINFLSTDLSTGTLVPGFDITFHPMLAYGPALEYAQPKNLPQTKSIAAELADYEARLRKQYSSKQKDRRYQITPMYQSMK